MDLIDLVVQWLGALDYICFKQSGFKPWSGEWCCVLGQGLQYTVLSISTQVHKWVLVNLMLGVAHGGVEIQLVASSS